ncbi:hypothetical protein HHK36_018114 [Tetracentron sinense]|uniref:Uncharacterized protein n=1 Tax=Tetracentron sinense TaxID=13715 RepID=A0A834Z0V5_TETSI|nr:hypothetical protein HHK36_018114 [Tetracentron sinense]
MHGQSDYDEEGEVDGEHVGDVKQLIWNMIISTWRVSYECYDHGTQECNDSKNCNDVFLYVHSSRSSGGGESFFKHRTEGVCPQKESRAFSLKKIVKCNGFYSEF